MRFRPLRFTNFVSNFRFVYVLHLRKNSHINNMDKQFEGASTLGLQKYPRTSSKILQYGTAGFREKAVELYHVMYRMGLLAVLRSKVHNGSTVGLMITASHNPEEDNGVKLCDPNGAMLTKEWELFATDLVNADNDSVSEVLNKIVTSSQINYENLASVYLAKDTRSSSSYLSNAAMDGVKILNGQVKDFGLLTTPQLHFVVFCKNYSFYGSPTSEGYYEKLSKAFKALTGMKENSTKKYKAELFVDGANGVGALKLKELQPYLEPFQISIFNDGSNGILNFKCGADFVKVDQKPPEGCDVIYGKRYASFDGDADRLIYFYRDQKGVFHLLDGDNIAVLIAKFLKDLIQSSNLSLETRVIQTAYANGSSTHYIENELKIPVICVPTGVKYLHHEALKYDVGIYFEANGHGTVVFSEDAKWKIRQLATNANADTLQLAAAKKLLSTIDIINETVGDAISDLLLTEAILQDLDWDIEDWNALYCNLTNRQLKVKVPDRQVFSTTDAERICVKPEGLQAAINEAVSKYSHARSFVRPSGTEDVVRAYAEAIDQDSADKLAEEVSLLVKRFTETI